MATNAALLAPVPRKIGASWYVSGRWYDAGHPYPCHVTQSSYSAGGVKFGSFLPPADIVGQKIGIYVAVAGAAGSTLRIGIYTDNNGVPGNLIYDSGKLPLDTTGIKSATCTDTLTGKTQYWFAVYTSATATLSTIIFTTVGHINPSGTGSCYGLTGQTGLPALVNSPVFAAAYPPRVMLQAQ